MESTHFSPVGIANIFKLMATETNQMTIFLILVFKGRVVLGSTDAQGRKNNYKNLKESEQKLGVKYFLIPREYEIDFGRSVKTLLDTSH